MAEPVLEARALTRTFGAKRALEGLSFRLEPGEVLGFLGPNGAGKSTTMRLFMGTLRPSAGGAWVRGRECWRERPAVMREVGFLPGELALYEELSGAALLELFEGLRGGVDRARRDALVRRLDLDLRPRVGVLSKGNRQKLGMVLALAHAPPVLLLDEPSSGLDPLLQQVFVELLLEEKARGASILLSSHILPEVDRLADRVAILRAGRLVALESMESLRARRERRLEASLSAPAGEGAFEGLEGVRVLERDGAGARWVLGVRGEPGPVLARLLTLGLRDLSYPPPDLESAFLQYYTAREERPA